MSDSRAYGCSSHTNGGKHLCSNSVRVKRQIAENALLKNVRDGLLGEDIVRHVQRSVRKAIGEYKKQHSAKSESIRSLEARTREISDKLERVANAIESMGLNNTLRDQIHSLEADKKATEASIVKAESAQPQMDGLPDIFPGLIDAWREIVDGIADIASNSNARPSEVQEARKQLAALLGTVTLQPRDGVLWAHCPSR